MEKRLKRIKLLNYVLLGVFDLLLLSLALSLFSFQIIGPWGLLIPISILILLLLTLFFREKLSNQFKEKIISFIVSDKHLSIAYQKKATDGEWVKNNPTFSLERMNLKTEDFITGVIQGVPFSSFEATIDEIKGKALDHEMIRIFQGRIIHLDIESDIDSVIREKKEDKLYGVCPFPPVHSSIEDSIFQDDFFLYGSPISPSFQKAVNRLNQEFVGQLSLSIDPKGISIFKANFENHFELDSILSLDDIRKEYEDEIGFIGLAISLFLKKE